MAELDFSYFQDNLFLAKICDKNDSVMRSNKSAKNQKEDYLKYGFTSIIINSEPRPKYIY